MNIRAIFEDRVDGCEPPGFPWPSRTARVVILGVFALIILVTGLNLHSCFAHHPGHYWANFQGWRLGAEYLRANLQAKGFGQAAATGEHQRLVVEGGYPFALFLLRRLAGLRAPFLLNALLLPLLLLLAAGFAGRIERPGSRRLLASWSALFLMLFSVPMAHSLWELVGPHRDMLSHVLGVAAVIIALSPAGSNDAVSARRCLFSGILVGLSAWTRLPAIVLAGPILLCLLVATRREPRFLLRAGMFCAGIGLGLLPLFLQNWIEGRSWLSVPQDHLLLGDEAPASGPSRRTGWHPLNAPAMIPVALRYVADLFPLWLHVFGWIGVAGSCVNRATRRRLIIPAAAVIAFGAFYSCYDKIVPRYAFSMRFAYVILLAVGWGWILHALVSLFARRPRMQAVLIRVLAFAVLAQAVRAGHPFWGEWQNIQNDWADARRFQQWAGDAFPRNSTVICSHLGVRMWLSYFSGLENQPWRFRPDWRARSDTASDARFMEQPLFFVNWTTPDGAEQASWWKDALLNSYDLDALDKPFLFSNGRGLLAYRIVPRDTRSRTVDVAAAPKASRWLYVFSRDLGTAERAQAVRLSSPGWPSPVAAKLVPGPNFIEVLPGPQSLASSVTFTSDEPLPALTDAQWVAPKTPPGLTLTDYNLLASHYGLFQNIRVFFRGYPHWFRDRGGYPEEEFRSVPSFLLSNGSSFRLPSFSKRDGSLVVRLYGSVTLADAESSLRQIRYEVSGATFVPLTILYSRETDRDGRVAFDFAHEVELPMESLASDQAETLILHLPESMFETQVVLHRVEFVPEDDSSRACPDGTSVSVIEPDWIGSSHEPWTRGVHTFRGDSWPGYGAKPVVRKLEATQREGTPVLCEGLLYELWRAYGCRAVKAVCEPEDCLDGQLLREQALSLMQERGSVLAAMPIRASEPGGLLFDRLKESFDLLPVASVANSNNQLLVFDNSPSTTLALCRVQPWRRSRVEQSVDAKVATQGLIRINTRRLWSSASPRTHARLALNGRTLDERVQNGFNYYRMPEPISGTLTLTLDSDAPVPGELDARILPSDKPIFLPVDIKQTYGALSILDSKDWRVAQPDSARLSFTHQAALRIPVRAPAETLVVSALLSAPRDDALPIPVSMTVSSNVVGQVELPRDGRFHPLTGAWTPGHDGDPVAAILRSDAPTPVEIASVMIVTMDHTQNFRVEAGEDGDDHFLAEGFYPAEFHRVARLPFRWTRESALAHLFTAAPNRAAFLRLHVNTRRPPGAPPADLQLRLNGEDVALLPAAAEGPEGFQTLEARIPASLLQSHHALLELRCQGWSPCQHVKSSDSRALGIMLNRVELHPESESATKGQP